MKTVKVICENPSCGKEFDKPKNEYNRSVKKERKQYCSQSCAGKASHSHLRKYQNKNIQHYSGNKRDKYTGLREHMRRVRQRDKDINLTLDDLLTQWSDQGGICPYTGIELTHPKQRKNKNLMYVASLDRIDSSKGYVKGNIQYVSTLANYAKSDLTHEQMIEFCKVITEHWSE